MIIAICDDNLAFLNELQSKVTEIITKKNILPEIKTFHSGKDLIQSVKSNSYDIIFLDIDMPDFNGKLVAQDLRRLSKNRFKLVFVSDYYDEVFSTFQYDIESFIPKNRLDEFLEEELLRIIDMIKSNERVSFSFKYSLKNRSVNGQVYLDEILYIESMNGEIFLHTQDKQYKLLNYKFEKVKSQFIKYGFVDIHRTCFVNVSCLSAVLQDCVVLRNNTKLPLSRRKRSAVNQAFFQHVKEKVIK